MGSRIVLLLLALLALHAVADEGEGESMGLPVVTDSSVVGVAAPRLTLIRPVNSTAVVRCSLCFHTRPHSRSS